MGNPSTLYTFVHRGNISEHFHIIFVARNFAQIFLIRILRRLFFIMWNFNQRFLPIILAQFFIVSNFSSSTKTKTNSKFSQAILFGNSDGEIPDNSLSRKELNELRMGLGSVINDTVLKRLTDAEIQYYQLKGGNVENSIRDFIQPVSYRLNKVIELSQK